MIAMTLNEALTATVPLASPSLNAGGGFGGDVDGGFGVGSVVISAGPIIIIERGRE
jgi:hypothetical protein